MIKIKRINYKLKIIQPNAIELVQGQGFDGMLKHIELCGRTCYKSEDRITEDSCHRFVNMLREHAHGAMLEHGTVYLEIPNEDIFKANDVVKELQLVTGRWARLASIVREPLPYSKTTFSDNSVCIATNYRVIVENDIEWLMEEYQCAPTEHHYKRRTFKITCNRGVSHEFVRHRVFSFAQESQRYVNYSKEKFGKDAYIAEPSGTKQQTIEAIKLCLKENQDMLDKIYYPDIYKKTFIEKVKDFFKRIFRITNK